MSQRSRILPVLATLLVACNGSGGDELRFFLFPTEVDLPPATYDDRNIPWTSIGFLNETFFPLTLDRFEVKGTGAPFLEFQVAGGSARDAVVGVRDSLQIRIRVEPPDEGNLADWTTTTQPLTAVLSFRVSGTGAVDATTGQPDLSQLQVQEVEIPVTFRLNCDRDGDGHDARACAGGSDCDDRLNGVHPGASEICDGIDNDCDGNPDDGGACVDLDD